VAYNDAHHRAIDWLTAAEQRLNKAAADGGDSIESVKRQLDLIKVAHNICTVLHVSIVKR
jgi:hypothetical protein